MSEWVSEWVSVCVCGCVCARVCACARVRVCVCVCVSVVFKDTAAEEVLSLTASGGTKAPGLNRDVPPDVRGEDLVHRSKSAYACACTRTRICMQLCISIYMNI